MNVGSLFSGVGGFDLGLERAGHKVIFQCEADEYRRKVLAQHWPGIPISSDVREVTPGWLRVSGKRGQSGSGGLDLICGGFPCQDLSIAGKRAGLAGERSGLFFEAARVADAFLGDGGWILIENVPGLLSSNNGRDFGIVLSTLADLGFYDLAWRVLDSRYFGVPQRRRRVFILARRASGRCAAEVLLEPEGGGGDFEASRATRKSPSGASERGAPGGSTEGVVSGTLTVRYGAQSGQDLNDNPNALITEGVHSEHEGRGALHREGRGGRPHGGPESAGDEANQLHPSAGGGKEARGSEADSDRVREASGVSGRVDDPAVTAFHATQSPITDDYCSPALGKSSQIGVSIRTAQTGANGWGIRQGEVGTLDKSMGQAVCSPGRDAASCPVDYAPDSPRYAAMGDAITVNVAEWIGHRLKEFG